MVIFSKTIFTDKASINGLMVVFTMDNGLTTKWKDKERLLGVMGVDMKETTKMIKSMVMVLLSGLTVENISENGAKANNMAKEFTSKKAKRGKVSGKWVKELSGSRLPRPTNDLRKIKQLHYYIIFVLIAQKLSYFT